ncbi:restriction endonuclease [Mesorhizobium sp. M2A.F.Ca.ET.037.01.1.1]|uniref:restriction endonuclease n=1 Tax=unclassified Mesorhizobium TaxID=325217 RepID=UPI000FCADBF4|nr:MULTISPECIES: restriction endonuclease [unclassified Mesorhizobium]RUY10099.1 restriction endonuclease [Mesorhizobium sp. M2A.F.Ca.ET.040.01.1.1]RUX03505.1 restriction endonuclease [Mesorhizobium sp. M2A.F.Ca.ET.037.01.1.1]RWA93618.1 MAG: restriction endonuclease [Mesorhizobium sp.]RWX65498.1 restriction endonuclease [Mesorhizobium sp. M2A.F.Ca.ET.039.01.1.1]TIV18835.1 MAG: restriction endonuclease [Mesorhizobium sp.]
MPKTPEPEVVSITASDVLSLKIDGAATVKIIFACLIIPDTSAAEDTLVRSTAAVWEVVVDSLTRKWDAHALSSRQWEELVAGAFKRDGFDEVILTPASHDYGLDVIATKHTLGTVKIIGSVKAYKEGLLVDYDAIARLALAILSENDVSKGYVLTTSDFPPLVAQDRYIGPLLSQKRLELINGDQLRTWLQKVKANP